MANVKKLPSVQRLRALRILADWEELVPSEFAKKMWPRSQGFNNHTKCGPKGSHRGGGMYLSAGGFLAKLSRAGLVIRRSDMVFQGHYRLSAAGRKLLEKYGA